MKIRVALASLILLSGISMVWWYGQSESEEEFATKVKLLRRSARGTADNPIAREQWEIERLKDPGTGRIPKGIRAKELAFAATIPTRESVILRDLQKGRSVQALTWAKRGPHNVGGRTRALAIDITNATTILGGGVSGGMWRSTDDGVNWVKTTGTSDIHSVTALAQDKRSGMESIWYYGTGEGVGNSASKSGAFFNGAGVFKSTNGGVSWSVLPSTVGTSPAGPIDSYFDIVYNLATDQSNSTDDEVYAATILGVHRSTNGGATWGADPVLGIFGATGSYFTDVQVTPGGVVYAALSALALDGSTNGNDKGIWRSIDGVTWTPISSGVAGFPSIYSRIVIGLAPSNANVAYFLIEGTNGTNGADQINDHQVWKYTYVSSDGSGAGGTWVNKGGSLPNAAGVAGNAMFDTQGSYDMLVQVKPDDENFVLIGGTNLYKTSNFSVATPTWVRMGGYAGPSNYAQYTNHHPDLHSGVFSPVNNSIYYSGHDGGISKTTDVTAGSVSWSFLNNGYVTSQFYTIAIDHATNGNDVVVGGLQDNGTWFTNSSTATAAWVDLLSGDGAFAAIADGRTSYYISSQSGNMYRVLLDANGTWTNYANIQPTGGSGYAFINPFVLDPNNTNMMYLAAGARVWRNSDLTAIPTGSDVTTTVNWTEFTNAVLPGSGVGELVRSLGVSKSGTANRLFIGSNATSVYRIDDAHTGIPTLTDVSGLNFPTLGGSVGCVAVNPGDANEVMAVFTNYGIPSLFHTTDGGASWTDVSANLEQNPDGTGNGPSCRWAAIIPGTGGTTYLVATSTGLYSAPSMNSSSTAWALEGSGVIGNVVVDMIDYRVGDGLVVVATHGNGVFSSNIVVSASTPEPTIPVAYGISQNYPNPFNPSTTISYTLPRQSRVNITVYDVAGREVSVLVDKNMNAGPQSVVWNARDRRGAGVSSGVYFYTIRATPFDGGEPFVRTEKMTYVK
ncbi:MAG: FlgD immunoglobulin-like domain containing protein [Bacteroidota bacterium]